MVDKAKSPQMYILSIDGNEIKLFDLPQVSPSTTANTNTSSTTNQQCNNPNMNMYNHQPTLNLPITSTYPQPPFVYNQPMQNTHYPPIVNVPPPIPNLPQFNVQQNHNQNHQNNNVKMNDYSYINQIADAIQKLSDVPAQNQNQNQQLPLPPIPTYIPQMPLPQTLGQQCQPVDSMQDIKANIKENKQIRCGLCNKTFSRRYNLKVHIKTHLKVQPFQCPTCNKQFTQKHSLVDHQRIHSGEKPFECDICHKRFRVKYNCKVHRRIHTGEKPYKCTFCEKTFASKSGLNSHLNRIHHSRNRNGNHARSNK